MSTRERTEKCAGSGIEEIAHGTEIAGETEGVMVHWSKRLLFAIVSTLVSVLVCPLAFWAVSGNLPGSASFPVVEALKFYSNILEVSIPGIAIGLPFVFLVKNLGNARFAKFLLIGACIGPVVFFGEAYFLSGEGDFLIKLEYMTDLVLKVLMSTSISTLATCIFLVLLRNALKKSCGGDVSEAVTPAGSTLNLRS
jgi:hypothetical protein